jgi:hypothetical protein
MLTAIPLWGGAVLSACSSDKDEPEPNTETSKKDPMVHITMTLDVGSANSTVESRDGETSSTTISTHEGSRDENYIDLDNVHVFLYDNYIPSDGNAYLYSKSLSIELTPTNKQVVNMGEGKYQITCDVPKDGIGTTFRIVITANWPHNPERIALSGDNNYNFGDNNYLSKLFWLNESDYIYDYGTDSEGDTTYFEPSASTPIPMYGVLLVSDYTNTDAYKAGNSSVDMLDLGIVYMFRAMAKIIVIDEDAKTKGTTSVFDKVTLSKCLNRGMCAPNKIFDQNTTEVTDNNICIPKGDTNDYHMFQDCSTLTVNGTAIGITYPSELGHINDLPLKRINAHEFVAYVPEYKLNTTLYNKNDNKTVTTGVPELDISAYGTKYVVEFKDYENGVATGDAFNILRNHIYEYHVSITNQTVISYVVKKWDEYNSDTIEFE